jgi:CPA2 family monovalent cation:H+ antiporter-2
LSQCNIEHIAEIDRQPACGRVRSDPIRSLGSRGTGCPNWARTLPLRDAFAVLFFVSVGMLFDPTILVREPLAVLSTVLIIVVGKSIAAFLIVLAFRHPMSTTVVGSVSLAQIGEFSFILAGLGLSLGLLPQLGHDLILAGALISILSNPLLFAVAERIALPVRAGEESICRSSGPTTSSSARWRSPEKW